jgi:glycine/D-amino acid oxidase-like deaminating enzyme
LSEQNSELGTQNFQDHLKDYPYWWDTVGGGWFTDPDSTTVPSRVDVAIIGGGYTGLAAARELARRGVSVAVLEAERIGWGASSRNGGQVLTGLKLDPGALVQRFGESRARELFELSRASIDALERLIEEEALDCEYQRTGHLQAAVKPSHFEAFRAEQALLARSFNHRVDLVPPAEQAREIGSAGYFGLMLDERSGALNPAQYARGLAAAARRAGARLCERTAVTRVGRHGPRWALATTRGDVEASNVLAATNGYTSRALPWLQRRVVPIGSYAIATAPLAEETARELLPTRRMVFDSRNFLVYFRLTCDGRLLFGGRARFVEATAQATERCAELLRRQMIAIFPTLAGVRVDYAWSGNVAFTRDQLPHAGQLSGAYYAGGYCGHGIAMATALGAAIARRMAGDSLEHPLFDDVFPPIPFYRGKPWFLPLVGTYYKLKDLIQ